MSISAKSIAGGEAHCTYKFVRQRGERLEETLRRIEEVEKTMERI